MENVELVQKGFRVLLHSLSEYIGRETKHAYGNNWWNVILYTVNSRYDLPQQGEYEELINSLDVANCFQIIDRQWNDLFRDKLRIDARSWSKELMGIRNLTAHLGQQDLDQRTAERALDTMCLLCREIDSESAEEIEVLYEEIRQKAFEGEVPVAYEGIAQPESASSVGALTEGSLLHYVGTEYVEKTTLTRKVTFGGKTEVYPVYRVRLDCLFYNNQNDRIATWISQYQSENGEDSLFDLDIEIYNRIIENFIVDSNPEAILKTQKNIAVVGQREPGVTLADGRIVDGNRRFTCLRRLQRDQQEPLYFETVIMDVDMHADKKQIKLLELAIQHGEEKKVDYDLIDYAIGTYRDIVQTNLLTVEEYANSTNETPAEVKKRLEIAGIIFEFLEYIGLPEQYHVAREYQVYSLFMEMLTPLKQLNDEEKQQLKVIAFNNAMMKAIKDQRKFIRDIKNLVKTGTYTEYFEKQKTLDAEIRDVIAQKDIHSASDLEELAKENPQIRDKMETTMEIALQRSRSKQLQAKPSDNVAKSIDLLMDVDPRLFDKLSQEEKMELNDGLDELISLATHFKKSL